MHLLLPILVWLSSFTSYNDIQQALTFLTDTLPPELKSSDLSARRKAWPEWVSRHDREIRGRLLRGDEDTIVNWLLFGTSFTRAPRALFDVSGTSNDLRRLISRRTKDLIAALRSAHPDERISFVRGLLVNQGYG